MFVCVLQCGLGPDAVCRAAHEGDVSVVKALLRDPSRDVNAMAALLVVESQTDSSEVGMHTAWINNLTQLKYEYTHTHPLPSNTRTHAQTRFMHKLPHLTLVGVG